MNFVLIVTNLAGGGAERAMLNIASLLAGRGHSVDLILLEQVIDHAMLKDINLHIIAPKSMGHGWLSKRLAAWRLANLWHKLNHHRRIDLTISTLPFCDEVVRLARLPRVRYRIANTLSAEIELLAQRNPVKAARRRERYRHLYGGQALVAVSQGVATDLQENLKLSSDIEVIHNPFDFSYIHKLAAEHVDNLPNRPFAIHVGRFAPQKRHDLLLDAWKLAGLDIDLVLLAEPSININLLIESRGLTGRVIVAGFQRNPFPWIAAAELLVLCSDHEGLPNVLVEALICGTRVVSTDCPSGPSEVLCGELARWLVPMNNATALAERMQTALQEARPVIQNELDAFAAATVAARYESLAMRAH